MTIGKSVRMTPSQRPKLSDPAHGTRELPTATSCRVRSCSAWVERSHGLCFLRITTVIGLLPGSAGSVCIDSIAKPSAPALFSFSSRSG